MVEEFNFLLLNLQWNIPKDPWWLSFLTNYHLYGIKGRPSLFPIILGWPFLHQLMLKWLDLDFVCEGQLKVTIIKDNGKEGGMADDISRLYKAIGKYRISYPKINPHPLHKMINPLLSHCMMLNPSLPGQNVRHFAGGIFRCIFVNEKFCIFGKYRISYPKINPHSLHKMINPLLSHRMILNPSLPGQNVCHFADGIFRCIFVNEKFCIFGKYRISYPKINPHPLQKMINPLLSHCMMLNPSLPGQNVRHFAGGIFRCIFVNEKFCIFGKYRISLSGEPDYFGRNEISSGGDLSHYSSASLY